MGEDTIEEAFSTLPKFNPASEDRELVRTLLMVEVINDNDEGELLVLKAEEENGEIEGRLLRLNVEYANDDKNAVVIVLIVWTDIDMVSLELIIRDNIDVDDDINV